MKIFIVGCGRSGTNWLGNIINTSKEIYTTIEAPETFNLVTDIVIKGKKELLNNLINRYDSISNLVKPLHYADKSHHNLWLVDDLVSEFSDSKFIGIYREVYGTVASMLKHKGVLSWFDTWDKYPVPNKFLGITNYNENIYNNYSLIEKCTLRWASHYDQLIYLQEKYTDKFLSINYDDLVDNIDQEVDKINKFLNLDSVKVVPVKKSLYKHNDLSFKDREEIANIIWQNLTTQINY